MYTPSPVLSLTVFSGRPCPAVRVGNLKRVQRDKGVKGPALQLLASSNMSNTFITCPRDPAHSLGVKLPCLTLVLKNLDQPCMFEAQVVDDKGVRRRFRVSSTQTTTRVKPFVTLVPLQLDAGWNLVRLNLAEYTRRAYGTACVEVVRVQIHAACRLRHVYLSEADFSDGSLPRHLRSMPKPKNSKGKGAGKKKS